jgi:hypothetical protein
MNAIPLSSLLQSFYAGSAPDPSPSSPSLTPSWFNASRNEFRNSSLYLPFRDLVRQQLYTNTGFNYQAYLESWDKGLSSPDMVALVDQVENLVKKSPLWSALRTEYGLKIEQGLKKRINERASESLFHALLPSPKNATTKTKV